METFIASTWQQLEGAGIDESYYMYIFAKLLAMATVTMEGMSRKHAVSIAHSTLDSLIKETAEQLAESQPHG